MILKMLIIKLLIILLLYEANSKANTTYQSLSNEWFFYSSDTITKLNIKFFTQKSTHHYGRCCIYIISFYFLSLDTFPCLSNLCINFFHCHIRCPVFHSLHANIINHLKSFFLAVDITIR